MKYQKTALLFVFAMLSFFSYGDYERILFLDNSNIKEKKGAEIKMHSPVPMETAFVFDVPWEGGDNGYVSVLKAENEFRMYYRGGSDQSREQSCVAFSKDGIKWERPNLGLFAFNNSKENNIVWMPERKSYAESHNFFAFIDDASGIKPDEKWKGFGLQIYPDEATKDEKRMLATFLSPDGIHWRRQSDKPAIRSGFAFDSLNTGFRDPFTNKYVCYSRVGLDGYRHIHRTMSDDFVNWSESEILKFPEPTKTHFYTNAIIPFPSLNPDDKGMQYIGMPMRFIPERKTAMGKTTDGVSDAVLIASRDGINWDFVSRDAWIRPGLNINNWGNAHGNNTPAHGVLKTGEKEWSVYWCENYGTNRVTLRRGSVRAEGFASLHAGADGGSAALGVFNAAGGEILLNASTSAAGSIRIGIADKDGKEIPGYGIQACPEIWGDDLMLPVVWNNNKKAIPDAPEFKQIQIKIEIKDADIYAIRIKRP